MNEHERIVTRRDFVGSGMVLAGGLLTGLAYAEPAAKESRQSIRLGLTTYTWGKDWDIPSLIANCTASGLLATELRTSMKYAHGVELETGKAGRKEVKKQFKDSPVALVGIACGERFDSPDPAILRKSIEASKAYVQLTCDVGATGLRVFPNSFPNGVEKGKTLAQIARSVTEVGKVAEDCGVEVRLEAHGTVGELPYLQQIMEQVESKAVRIKLNCDKRDKEGEGFEHNFNLVRKYLGGTIHAHDLNDPGFPYQEQMNQLVKTKWEGWILLELSGKFPDDRIKALREQRTTFDTMLTKAKQSE